LGAKRERPDWRRPVTYRTPLAKVPFPRVRGTRAQARALRRAIGHLPLRAFPASLERAGGKRVSAVTQRAVLEAIASHANGAGFTFLKVTRIAHESGYCERTVYRALAALETQGHLERHYYGRRPSDYSREGLSPLSRIGHGSP
jgi:hypothetical protein